MPSKVRIPTPLRPMVGGKSEVAVEGATVREVIEALAADADGLRDRLLDDQGQLRRFVNVFLNKEDIRHLAGLDSAVKDGDELAIVPAIAGG